MMTVDELRAALVAKLEAVREEWKAAHIDLSAHEALAHRAATPWLGGHRQNDGDPPRASVQRLEEAEREGVALACAIADLDLAVQLAGKTREQITDERFAQASA